MIVVSVCCLKGGVGKSTISTALAVRATEDFSRVGIIDVDPNQGATQWHYARIQGGFPYEPTVLSGAVDVSEALKVFIQDSRDFVIIDGGPSSSMLAQEAIDYSEIAIVPTRSAGQDFGSTCDTIEICRSVETPFLLVLNEMNPARNDEEDERTRGAITVYEREVGPISWGPILHRCTTYQDAVMLGLGPHEVRASNTQARDEIEELYRQALQMIAEARDGGGH